MTKLLATAILISTFAHAGIRERVQPQRSRVTIIDLTNGADHALLIGGWNGKKWIRDEAFNRSVFGGERYRFYGFNSMIGEATGGKAKLSEASGSAWQIEINKPRTSKEDLIGLTGRWNALPRKPQVVKDHGAYRGFVSAVLKQHGIKTAPVHITRAIRVDLDGDGKQEEIVSATCPRLAKDEGEAMMSSRKGDYSFILVRSRSGGKTVSTLLDGAYWFEPGSTSTVNEIGGTLDLNGDGKLEIIERTHYYEGGGARIYEFRAGRPRLAPSLAAIDGA